ncbi:MAG: hypothetical protein QOH96_3669 [Blastocatellia bacterium]|nr:hypothetical protein [Blastocatellia bacterium]
MVIGKWFVIGCVAANVGWLTLGDPTRPFHNTTRNVLTIYYLLFTIHNHVSPRETFSDE